MDWRGRVRRTAWIWGCALLLGAVLPAASGWADQLGNSASDGTAAAAAGDITGNVFTAGSGFTADSLSVSLSSTSLPTNVVAAIYATSGSVPTTLIAQTSPAACVPGLNTYPLPAVPILNGNTYYLCVLFDNNVVLNTLAGGQRVEQIGAGYSAVFPGTLGVTTPGAADTCTLYVAGSAFTPTFTATPTLTMTPTATGTGTGTETVSPTSTPTPTVSATPTPTGTASDTPTLSATPTISGTPTQTATASHTPTATSTVVGTFTETPTFTHTATASATATVSPSASGTPTRTASSTFTPTRTASATSTSTSTATPTRTESPTLTPTPTISETPSVSPTPTISATHTVSTTISPTPTVSETPLPSATATSTRTLVPFSGTLSAVTLSRKIFTPTGNRETVERFSFQSAENPGDIKAAVFDAQGRKVAALPIQGVGPDYWAQWDGRNDGGKLMAPGIYIYEIKVNGAAHRGAVVLAR